MSKQLAEAILSEDFTDLPEYAGKEFDEIAFDLAEAYLRLEDDLFGIETVRNQYLEFISELSIDPAHTRYLRFASEIAKAALMDDGEWCDEIIEEAKEEYDG